MKDHAIEEIFTYNELLDHINNSSDNDLIELRFKRISSHKVLLPQSYPNCDGSNCLRDMGFFQFKMEPDVWL